MSAAIPQHVAIIMDGNGRWATQRGQPRLAGHQAGVAALQRTVEACLVQQIRYLTVYAFSTENWQRPAAEVTGLLRLLREGLRQTQTTALKNQVALRVIGDLGPTSRVPAPVRAAVAQAVAQSPQKPKLTLTIAFNYGGRDELVRACQRLLVQAQQGAFDPTTLTPAMLAAALDTAGLPDPDLLIRTSGEQRLSNFLPWQTAYSELVFTPTLWPDFSADTLAAAVAEFGRRQRRFGGVVALPRPAEEGCSKATKPATLSPKIKKKRYA